MHSFFKTVVVASVLLLPQWVLAGPILFYEFQIGSFSLACPSSSCHSHIGQPYLNGMYIGLDSSAIAGQAASLQIDKNNGGPSMPVINHGVYAVNLFVFNGFLDYVPAHGEILPPSNRFLDGDILFENIDLHLDGLIDLYDSSTQIRMWSLESGGWAGEIGSDGIEGNGKFVFTGEWKYTHTVPEPGSIMLLFIGLAAMFYLARSKSAMTNAALAV